MPTKNRLREFFVGDACALTRSGMLWKSEYARADLEDRLLMVDDDMDMSALTKTNYIKSIVTSECQMDVERKYEQSHDHQLGWWFEYAPQGHFPISPRGEV